MRPLCERTMTGPVGRFGFVYARASGRRLEAGAQCGPRGEGCLNDWTMTVEDAPGPDEEGEEPVGVGAVGVCLRGVSFGVGPAPAEGPRDSKTHPERVTRMFPRFKVTGEVAPRANGDKRFVGVGCERHVWRLPGFVASGSGSSRLLVPFSGFDPHRSSMRRVCTGPLSFGIHYPHIDRTASGMLIFFWGAFG